MSRRNVDDRGYAMAALLVGMSVMAIILSMALPVWQTAVKREREAELVFRGEQYAQAIELFSRRNGGFPPSLDVLVQGRYIRKLYKDPMTREGDFQPVYFGQVLPGQAASLTQPGRGGAGGGPIGQLLGTAGGRAGQAGSAGAGPIIGVVSTSDAESLRLYNDRGRYDEWAFVAIVPTAQPGGSQNPGPGRAGQGTQQGLPGRGVGLSGRGSPGSGGSASDAGNPSGLQGRFPFPVGR